MDGPYLNKAIADSSEQGSGRSCPQRDARAEFDLYSAHHINTVHLSGRFLYTLTAPAQTVSRSRTNGEGELWWDFFVQVASDSPIGLEFLVATDEWKCVRHTITLTGQWAGN